MFLNVCDFNLAVSTEPPLGLPQTVNKKLYLLFCIDYIDYKTN